MTPEERAWAQVLEVEPEAIAKAIDKAGMLACFTTAPYYHEISGRWIPTGDGRRTNLGLTPIANADEQVNTLEVRPGYQDLVAQQLEEHRQRQLTPVQVTEVQSPTKEQLAPEYTDPTVRGPDAVAQPEVQADEPEFVGVPPEHPMSNGQVERVEVGGLNQPPRVVESRDLLLASVVDLSLEFFEALPKAKREKIADQAKALRELRDRLEV